MGKFGGQRGIGKGFIRSAIKVFQVKNTPQLGGERILGHGIVVGQGAPYVRTDECGFLLVIIGGVDIVVIPSRQVEEPLERKGLFQTNRTRQRVQRLPVGMDGKHAGGHQGEIKKTLHAILLKAMSQQTVDK